MTSNFGCECQFALLNVVPDLNKSKNGEAVELALYISELQNEKWSKGKEMPLNSEASAGLGPWPPGRLPFQ